jgi:hypothetical protein
VDLCSHDAPIRRLRGLSRDGWAVVLRAIWRRLCGDI